MVELIRFTQLGPALLLRDYLLSEHIHCRLNTWNREVRLVVRSEDYAKAQSIVADYQRNPWDPKYRGASWKQGTVLSGSVYAAAEKRYWHSLITITGPLTLIVLLLCFGVFLLTHLPGGIPMSQLQMPDRLGQLGQQPWLLLTPALVHITWMHLIFNGLWWWEFARRIEAMQGWLTLLLLMVVMAASSNLAQFWWAGSHFAGLSGVIMGLGGYLLMMRETVDASTGRLPPGLALMIGVALLLGATGILDALDGPVAQAAHLSGFLTGVLLGLGTVLYRRFLRT